MQVFPLSVLTSLKVEETEVEEGKWKEGARGAPRSIAVTSSILKLRKVFCEAHLMHKYFVRRRGEKSGREDGGGGG